MTTIRAAASPTGGRTTARGSKRTIGRRSRAATTTTIPSTPWQTRDTVPQQVAAASVAYHDAPPKSREIDLAELILAEQQPARCLDRDVPTLQGRWVEERRPALGQEQEGEPRVPRRRIEADDPVDPSIVADGHRGDTRVPHEDVDAERRFLRVRDHERAVE